MDQPSDAMGRAPVMIDVLSSAGRIVYANAAQEAALGFEPGLLTGRNAERVYGPEALRQLERLFAGGPLPTTALRLQLRRADGASVNALTQAERFEDAHHGLCLRLYKFVADGMYERLEFLETENEVLSSIVSTARDATYCVEFLEPVDLTAPDHEIVRQVFENQCVWRYCNESMAQLYRLPPGDDLNKHDVREVFPRNPDNEAFVARLIESGWRLDAALARDHRYDGRDVYVENDVRADIRLGQLHRFWGTVRDPTARRMRERELEHQVAMALDILGALPDPVIVVDEHGRIEGVNPAVEWKLGWRQDALLGVSVDRVLTVGLPNHELVHMARPPAVAGARRARAHCRDGRMLGCEAVLTEVGGDSGQHRCAAILRFAPQPDPSSPQASEKSSDA